MNNIKLRTAFWMALILIITVILCNRSEAAPQTPRVLKLAHFWPATSLRQQMFEQWANRIEAGTNGKVKIVIYPGATLVPPMETWTSIVTGACDIGSCWANMHRAGFHFNTGQLFFWTGVPSIDWAIQQMDSFRKKYPILEKEYAEAKVLWTGVHGSRQLFTVRKAVRSLEDMRGLQIRAATPAEVKFLQAVKGVPPAFVPMSEVYTSLQKAMIDGLWCSSDVLKSYRLGEVVKYVTKTNFEIGHNKYVAMNWNVWNSLSPDIQKVFEKESPWAKTEDIILENKGDADGVEFAKSKGVEFIELPPEEYAKLKAIVESIQNAMAADLDAKGYPGTALLNDIRDAISKTK